MESPDQIVFLLKYVMTGVPSYQVSAKREKDGKFEIRFQFILD